jgi:glycosyltransferase involved in cell wall biosynthesis
MPLVSVNVIVYNREHCIGRCIQSVFDQDYENIEIIVIDDGSTDKTSEIVKSFGSPRIKYHKNNKNEGINYSRNIALSLSTGEYIAILDSDDFARNDRIRLQAEYLVTHQNTAAIASFAKFENEDGAVLPNWEEDRMNTSYSEIRNILWKRNCIAHSTVMVRNEIIRIYEYNPYQLSEDYDLWLNLISDNYVLEKLPLELVTYTVSKISASNEQDSEHGYLDKTRITKWRYLQRRVKKKRITKYDLWVLHWILASYIPFLRK